MSIVGDIKNAIVAQAGKTGGATWQQGAAAVRANSTAYAQALESLSKGALSGEIPESEVADRAALALAMFAQAVQIEVSQILLSEIQTFLNAVIDAARVSINAALPFPVL